MNASVKPMSQLDEQLFVADGGLETTLIFHEGIELPYFGAFDLLKDAAGGEQAAPLLPALRAGARTQHADLSQRRGMSGAGRSRGLCRSKCSAHSGLPRPRSFPSELKIQGDPQT